MTSEGRPSYEQLAALVQAQRRQIDEQARQIETLQAGVAELENPTPP